VAVPLDSLKEKLAAKRALQKTVQKPQRALPAPRQQAKIDEKVPAAPQTEIAALSVIFQHPAEGFLFFDHYGRPGFFYSRNNRDLFGYALAFYSRTGVLDLMSFTQYLIDQDKLAHVGGPAELTALFTNIAPLDLLEYYVDELREKYVRRQLFVIATDTLKTLQENPTEERVTISDIAIQTQQQVDNAVRLSANARLFPLLGEASQFLNGHMPELPPQLIAGILHQGSKMVLGGTSKARKSMALIDLATSIASGADWWGFKTTKRAVCYINFEIQDAFFWFRLDQIKQAKGIQLDQNCFYALNLRGHADRIENLHDKLLSMLKPIKFGFIAIDPIYKALGGRDENKAGDVAAMLNEVEKLAVETGAAIAFGAHYSKGNQAERESMDRIGGSGVFARDPDSILTMTQHESMNCFSVETTLRNFKPVHPFVVEWDWPLFRLKEELDPKKLHNRGQFEARLSDDMIMNELSIIDGVSLRKLKALMDELHNMKKSEFYRRIERLKSEQKIVVKDHQVFKRSKETREEPF
jgi:AAA domain/DnaB-like helicase N terminal domain